MSTGNDLPKKKFTEDSSRQRQIEEEVEVLMVMVEQVDREDLEQTASMDFVRHLHLSKMAKEKTLNMFFGLIQTTTATTTVTATATEATITPVDNRRH
jgi:hypothetical protein